MKDNQGITHQFHKESIIEIQSHFIVQLHREYNKKIRRLTFQLNFKNKSGTH